MDSQADAIGTRPPTLTALALTCCRIGFLSFGGGLSGWLHREFVGKKQWVSEDDFIATMAIAQMLPGANVINLIVCLGEQLGGPVGAALCFFSFLIGPFFSIIALGSIVGHVSNVAALDAGLLGVAAAATGMLIVVCWHGVRRVAHQWPQLLIIAIIAVTVGLLQWPLLAVVACVAPVSVAISWRGRVKKGDDAR